MDSQAKAATPSKAGREGTTGVADISTPGPGVGTPAMMDVSSPDPAPFWFARQKHPPAISSKPRSSRKVSSLFSSDTGETADSSDAAAAKKKVGDTSSIAPAGGSPFCAGGDQTASPASGSRIGGGGSGGAGFTSPVRASRESGATSSRFTPQRNLGGLFASPLPPPLPPTNEEDGGVTAAPPGLAAAAVPLLLRSPKREEPASAPADEAASTRPEAQTAVEKPPASTAVSPVAAPAPVTPSPVAALAAAAAAAAPAAAAAAAAAAAPTGPFPVCRCGCPSSGVTDTDCGDLCCVSNEAFKDGKPMRTLEVLVKRDRVGVSALASWRVSELKRRLVHLKFFPAAEVIALVPTFPPGGAALEDDVVLDTLDADATYKARRVAVPAAT